MKINLSRLKSYQDKQNVFIKKRGKASVEGCTKIILDDFREPNQFCAMDWKFFLQTLITVAVAAIGWVIVHHFNSKRDSRNKRTELRLKYLIESYRRLERACEKETASQELVDEISATISDLQLLGDEQQVLAARTVARTFTGTHTETIDLSRLLTELRNTIRTELGLSPLPSAVEHLRLTYHPPLKKQGEEDTSLTG